VEKFLNGKIGFLDIARIQKEFHNIKLNNIDDIFLVNDCVHKYAMELV
jgi:1-deoxy-D-xylulose 5-phosphate reductoisomerase